MKKLLLFLSLGALLFTGCSKNDFEGDTGGGNGNGDGNNTGTEIVTNLAITGLNEDVAAKSGNLLAVQLYRADENGAYKPYAHGLFNNYADLKFNAVVGDSYKAVATLVGEAQNNIAKDGSGVYGKPFGTAITDGFVYDETEMTGLSSSEAAATDGTVYTRPAIDRYYTSTTQKIEETVKSIELDMHHVSFKVSIDVDQSVGEGASLTIPNAPIITLTAADLNSGTETYAATSAKLQKTIYYSFTDIISASAGTVEGEGDSQQPYKEDIELTITAQDGSTIYEGDVNFGVGSDLLSIATNDDGYLVVGEESLVPEEKKITYKADNLFYSELPVGIEKVYRIEVESQELDPNMVKWYVDGTLRAKGLEFNYVTEAGNHTVSYSIPAEYSITGEEVTKGVSANVYTSDGVYILNEPNMTGAESARGINRHIFGTNTVDRFIIGDYTQFGTTSQYIANWAGVLYVIGSYPQAGVGFSSFNATTGDFIHAVKSVNGLGDAQVRAFAGITPEQGVITTESGAYIVELNGGNFSIGTQAVKGTESGSRNVLVTDGYIFIISNGRAIAYKAEGFNENSEPIDLGGAQVGFVQSKDGNIWAADGNYSGNSMKTLLCINPKDLSTETKEISAQVGFYSATWKQVAWAASTKENALYFTPGGRSSLASSITKYDITTGTVTTEFKAKADMDDYCPYATALYYEPTRGELISSGIKGFGGQAAYNALHAFNDNGDKIWAVTYTNEGEYLDMCFPAMMVPIKNFSAPVR
ncbi:MAG TPA: DUF5074 domain-containing protein [Candidatus Avirikenella pullistercoris]|nr:DUF5074 domain-containing protein [Candidatus Avirikenella pullistercoris]